MVKIVSSLAPPTSNPPLPANPVPPLVLHLDINETILVGDEAGGDTRDESLNKILAKSAYCKLPADYNTESSSLDDVSSVEPTHWWDGTKIGDCSENHEPPPLYTGWEWPPGCVPYYRTAFKSRAKQFIEGDGKCYKDLYDKMQDVLLQDDSLPEIMSHVLPSLFHTLATLSERNEPFVLVLRSFGSDIENVAEAISLFAQGKHPDYPNFRNDALVLATPNNLAKGRWSTKEMGEYATFQLYSSNTDDDDTLIASGDEEVLEWIQERTICGIQDDYLFWSRNDCQPWAGKPVWALTGQQHHHLLFDDNIHNLEHDSIATVRIMQSSNSFRTLRGREVQQQQGIRLVRVPTIEPILNPDWFLEQIDQARARYAAATEATSKDDAQDES